MTENTLAVQPGGATTSIQGMPISPYATMTQQEPRYFTAEDLERARQQEKDKLYDRLQKTDAQLNEFKTTVESLAADKQARDKELENQKQTALAAAKKLEDEKLSAQQLLEKRQSEFELQQKMLRDEMELKLTTMQREQDFLRKRAYIQKRINEEVNAATIIPDLAEYITGDTEEEIEASIQKAKDKTASIITGAQSLTSPSSPMGTSPTGTPFSPLDNLSGPRQYTSQQIQAMNNTEFSEYRKLIGLDRAGSGRGLF